MLLKRNNINVFKLIILVVVVFIFKVFEIEEY